MKTALLFLVPAVYFSLSRSSVTSKLLLMSPTDSFLHVKIAEGARARAQILSPQNRFLPRLANLPQPFLDAKNCRREKAVRYFCPSNPRYLC